MDCIQWIAGLARVELFLGIAATLQHYHLLPTEESPIDLQPKSTINMMPKQQNLKLVPVRIWMIQFTERGT